MRLRLQKGFTIVEVLVASVLLSVAAVEAGRCATTLMKNDRKASDMLEQSQMSRIGTEMYRARPYDSLVVGGQPIVEIINSSGMPATNGKYKRIITVTQPAAGQKRVIVQVAPNPAYIPNGSYGG